MSRAFNDTDALDGLVQKYEEEIGVDYGFISGNTTRLKTFTSGTKTAWDRYLHLAFKASGTWQYDDSNHPKFPIIYATLTSGQQDYTFTTDQQGNLVIDIHRVAILSSATETKYEEIYPIDEQSNESSYLLSEDTDTGVPYRYDKTANGIMLDQTPSYTVAKGLKVYINRESSYFVSTDTTKKPGCPGIHHDYFYLRPAMEHARRNNLPNYATLRDEVISYEGDEKNRIVGSIERDFSRRERDKKYIITPQPVSFI